MRESRKHKILLGSFALLDSLNKIQPGVVPIAISLSVPKWAESIKKYSPLAPTKELVEYIRALQKQKDISTPDLNYFVKEYTMILANLNRNVVYNELRELAGTNNFILLSHENTNEIGHRYLVQKWYQAQQDIYSVKEIYSASNAVLETGGPL